MMTEAVSLNNGKLNSEFELVKVASKSFRHDKLFKSP